MTAVALSILETTAVLLTLLFIGLQFLARQIDDATVPKKALQQVANSIPLAAIGLVVAIFFAGNIVASGTDSIQVLIMMGFFVAALAFLSVGVIRASNAIVADLGEDLQEQEPEPSIETEIEETEP